MLTIPTQGALYHLLYIPITTSYHNFHSLAVVIRFSSWHKIGITIFFLFETINCEFLRFVQELVRSSWKLVFRIKHLEWTHFFLNWYPGFNWSYAMWNGFSVFGLFFVAGLVTQSFATWRKSPKNFKIIYFWNQILLNTRKETWGTVVGKGEKSDLK